MPLPARSLWVFVLLGALLLAGCQAPAAPAPAKPAASAAVTSAPAAPTAAPAPAQPTAAAPPPAQPTTAPATATPPPLQTLKLGDARALTLAPVYVAIEKGYLREQGLAMELETIQGGDSAAYLTSGQLDLTLDAVAVSLFNAFERGADMRIIAPGGILTLEDSPLPLVVRKELYDSGAVRTVADLKGRRVAVLAPGATPDYLLTRLLDPLGLSINDLDRVMMPFPDMPTALANGSLDAAVPAEPFATRAVSQGSAVKLVTAIAPGRMTTVITASGQALRDRPELLRRWTVAWAKGIRDIQPPQLGVWDAERFYKPEHLAILTKYLNLPEAVLREQVPYTWDVDLVIQGDSIMDIQQTHMRNGALQIAQPVSVERMIDYGPSEYALQQLGRLRQ